MANGSKIYNTIFIIILTFIYRNIERNKKSRNQSVTRKTETKSEIRNKG